MTINIYTNQNFGSKNEITKIILWASAKTDKVTKKKDGYLKVLNSFQVILSNLRIHVY